MAVSPTQAPPAPIPHSSRSAPGRRRLTGASRPNPECDSRDCAAEVTDGRRIARDDSRTGHTGADREVGDDGIA